MVSTTRSARLLVASAALLAALLPGCAGLPESHPPGGTVINAVEKECFGPFTTASKVVQLDGAHGPEYYRLSYTYRAMLVGGSAEVRDTGGVRLLEGTLLVHADRSLERISAKAARSAVGGWGGDADRPTVADAAEWALDELLAQQLIAPGGREGKDGSTPVTSLWWYPIVVGNPTQGGTTGTTFVVQQSTDSAGAGVTRFFLRPPIDRLCGPSSQLWISSSNYDDRSVTWLTDTESYAESSTVPAAPPQSPKDPKDPKDPKNPKNQGVAQTAHGSGGGHPVTQTTIHPLTNELRAWLADLERAAKECGMR